MFSKAKSGGKSGNDGKNASGSLNEAPPPQMLNQPTSSNKKNSGPTRSSGVPSLISADVVMNGNINSAGEIQFDGTLDGDIKAASLIIGEKATVRGEIVCDIVMVRGRVEGAIRAKSVSLAATAHIQGDILHSSLSVETGAHFEGNCRHSDDPLSDGASRDFRRSPASAPAPKPVASLNNDDDGARPAGDAPSFLNGTRSPLR